MKTLVLAILLLSLVAASASDVRYVSGKYVDLEPLHKWERVRDSVQKDSAGPRPLPQWEKLSIKLSQKTNGGWLAKPTGSSKPVFIKNVPSKYNENSPIISVYAIKTAPISVGKDTAYAAYDHGVVVKK